MIKYICDKCGAELPKESDRYTRQISNNVYIVRTYMFCYKCDKAFWEHLCLFTKKDEEVITN